MSNFLEKWIAGTTIIKEYSPVAMSLEEIIEICQRYQRSKSAMQLFSLMRCQLNRHNCDKYLNTLSMKELWFEYMMLLEYKKRWNNDKKKWEDIDV